MPTREIVWGDVRIQITTPRSEDAASNKKYAALADLAAHNAVMTLVEKHGAILTTVKMSSPQDNF